MIVSITIPHIVSLLISAVCFFTAFTITEKSPNNTSQVGKLVALWYTPLFFEILTHFYTHRLLNNIKPNYNAEDIAERCSTVFIIVLGVGLVKITNGLQYFVQGAAPIGSHNALQISCAAVIYILHFVSYFRPSRKKAYGCQMELGHFFFHFFFLSSLLITLQGIASMLRVGVSTTQCVYL